MRRFAILIALYCLARSATDARPQPASAVPAPILVELFTSEGCSDCPPADALLQRIKGTRTPQGQSIFVLSEHVTYWDQLGWRDRFSGETFTARQNDYAQHFNLDSVYTPQMVVNGTKQFVGNNSGALRDVLLAEQPRPAVELHVVTMMRDPRGLTVHFVADNVSRGAPLDIFAAVTDDLDETHVGSGENGGRTLTHVSVARSLDRIAEIRGNTDQSVHISWPAALKGAPEAPRHLLLFAQQHTYGSVKGATSEPLPKSGLEVQKSVSGSVRGGK